MICAQVSNPRGGFRQVLAPWAPKADVTVTLVNQTKTRDREFVVTREELAARASAESTYGSLLSFGKSGTAVGVADLVDRATLDREFLGDNDVLVVAVTCDEPEAEPLAPPTPEAVRSAAAEGGGVAASDPASATKTSKTSSLPRAPLRNVEGNVEEAAVR